MNINRLTIHFKNLHIMDSPLVDMETECSADKMESLNSGGTGIDDQHVPPCIAHDLQYMGMSADEEIGLVTVYQFAGPDIVFSGISADMGHEYLHSLTLKKTMQRVVITETVIVTVACDTHQRLEGCNFLGKPKSPAEISRMPDLVDICKEIPELPGEYPVCIRYQSYVHVRKIMYFCALIFRRMELFYSKDIEGNICRLDQDESAHCIKVLRHRCGEQINVIDGSGTLHRCRIISDSPKSVEASVIESIENWGSHPYRLHMAVCPTKNSDRYEWFAEKACEIGFDVLHPVIGEHSERRVFKTRRMEKILVSAAKQSLKAAIPDVNEPVSVKEFIHDCRDMDALKLIAYCFEDENVPRRSIKEVLETYNGLEIIVLIGPEGDFSKQEADLALKIGFIPVHLGDSRLRTETAALAAVSAVYFKYM